MSKLIQELQTGGHAYLIFGSRKDVVEELRGYIKETYNLGPGSPDYIEHNTDSFGIDEVRELTARVYQKNIAPVSTVILSVQSITGEAQNALLKTLEEPQTNTLFFVVMPHGAYVLETILSRVSTIMLESQTAVAFSYKTYLGQTFPERIAYIEKLTKDKETDSYDKEMVAEIIQLILEGLHEEGKHSISKDIQDVTKYIYDQSASVKHIIEYMSLMVK